MKIKNKGKVYPSPPPPPSSSSSVDGDGFLSVLKLLPAAILVLASALSAEDREVLAYLITRSLKITTIASAAAKSRSPSAAAASSSSSSAMAHDSKKKKKSGKRGETHKPPEFDCECFDCYTSYWFRWDSSANRELIHQVIEAFEDHLISGEASASASHKPRRNNGKGKKKEKSARRGGDKPNPVEPSTRPDDSAADITVPEVSPVPGEVAVVSPANSPGRSVGVGGADVAERGREDVAEETPTPENSTVAVRTSAETERKGLARKVLPDVLSIFNSRLWSLWSPNA